MTSANKTFSIDANTLLIPIGLVLFNWLVFWFEVRFGFYFNDYGIGPKSFSGLIGILFSPFLHGSIEHLYNNTIPLFLLSLALFYFYRQLAIRVLGLGIILSGFLTWLLGEANTHHIGASGVIYVLASFLFFKGIWSKNYRLTALSLIVVFIYGSLVWGVLPGLPNVSWEGHLGGFISGVILAFVYKNKVLKQEKKYDWEKETYNEEDDEFMKHFDEKGNFVPSSAMQSEEDELTEMDSTSSKEVKIIYHVKNESRDEKL